MFGVQVFDRETSLLTAPAPVKQSVGGVSVAAGDTAMFDSTHFTISALASRQIAGRQTGLRHRSGRVTYASCRPGRRSG